MVLIHDHFRSYHISIHYQSNNNKRCMYITYVYIWHCSEGLLIFFFWSCLIFTFKIKFYNKNHTQKKLLTKFCFFAAKYSTLNHWQNNPLFGTDLMASKLCVSLRICAQSSRWYPTPGICWNQRATTPLARAVHKHPKDSSTNTQTHTHTPYSSWAGLLVYEQLLKLADGVRRD